MPMHLSTDTLTISALLAAVVGILRRWLRDDGRGGGSALALRAVGDREARGRLSRCECRALNGGVGGVSRADLLLGWLHECATPSSASEAHVYDRGGGCKE